MDQQIEPNHTNRSKKVVQIEPNKNISSLRHSIEPKTFLRDNNGDLVLIPMWTVTISIGVGGNTTSSSPLILYNIMAYHGDGAFMTMHEHRLTSGSDI